MEKLLKAYQDGVTALEEARFKSVVDFETALEILATTTASVVGEIIEELEEFKNNDPQDSHDLGMNTVAQAITFKLEQTRSELLQQQ